MVRQNFEVEVPDGMHLGFARDGDGALRGLLFDDDTNDLVGHAKLFEPEGDWSDKPDQSEYLATRSAEEDELIAQSAAALAALVILGIEIAAPHVKRWWRNQAAPAVRATRARVKSRLKRPRDKSDDYILAPDVLTLADLQPSSGEEIVRSVAMPPWRRRG